MIPLFKESSSRKDYILSKNGYIAANTPVAIIELDYKSSKLSSAITFSQEINQSQVLKSPGIERLNMGYLFDENTLANENNVSVKFVDNYKTMILYFPLDVGSSYYSGKSDGSYDLTVDGMGKEEFLELMRKSGDKAKEYIKWAKEKGILIIGLYISDRSIDSKAVYNGIINGVASECDFLIVTDDANNEDTFANISKNKNIPIQIISSGLGSTNKYLIEALKSIFVNE